MFRYILVSAGWDLFANGTETNMGERIEKAWNHAKQAVFLTCFFFSMVSKGSNPEVISPCSQTSTGFNCHQGSPSSPSSHWSFQPSKSAGFSRSWRLQPSKHEEILWIWGIPAPKILVYYGIDIPRDSAYPPPFWVAPDGSWLRFTHKSSILDKPNHRDTGGYAGIVPSARVEGCHWIPGPAGSSVAWFLDLSESPGAIYGKLEGQLSPVLDSEVAKMGWSWTY